MSGITDPVSDYLTRIRNGQQAGRKYVDIPASRQKRAITQILLDKGYIRSYLDVDDGKQGLIRIRLKYDAQGEPVIRMMKRVSTPGLRRYTRANELPRVMNGLGIAILSTSRGMMTDKEARKAHIGGEVLAYLY